MKGRVYILLFNSEVLSASVNITVLYNSLCNRAKLDFKDTPDPYHTVRRRLIADGKYIFEHSNGWKYQIIARDMLRKPVQRRLDLFQDTSLKQTESVGTPPKG